MPTIPTKVIKNNPIYRYCWNKCREQNSNVNGVFVGKPGSGKSYACLRMAYDLDVSTNGKPRFNVDEQLFFEISDFVKAITSGKYPKGSVFIVEEAGIQANARNWYSDLNKIISYVMQSFRKFNYITFLNLPSMNALDKQLHPLFHFTCQMSGINERKNVSNGRIKFIDYNSLTGDTYPKYFRYYDEDNYLKVKKIEFDLPPKDMCEQYDARAKKVLNRWYSTYIEQAELYKDDEDSQRVNPHEWYRGIIENPEKLKDFWNFEKNCVDIHELKFIGIGHNMSYSLRRKIEKAIYTGKLSPPRLENSDSKSVEPKTA